MLGNTVKKVTWMARATTTIVGLAIMLALVFGVATTALAGTGIGATFNLGKTNTVNAISKLIGSVAGPSLLIDNNSTDAAATALDLQVEAGKAPMRVNSGGKVANLNADRLDDREASSFASGVNGKATDADKLDGVDSSGFLPKSGKAADADRLDGKSAEAFLQKSYDYHLSTLFVAAGATENIVADCLPGQVAVTGGYTGVDPGTHVFVSKPEITFDGIPPKGWEITVQRNSSTSGDFVNAFAACVNP
jgi:hypothetical protein